MIQTIRINNPLSKEQARTIYDGIRKIIDTHYEKEGYKRNITAFRTLCDRTRGSVVVEFLGNGIIDIGYYMRGFFRRIQKININLLGVGLAELAVSLEEMNWKS